MSDADASLNSGPSPAASPPRPVAEKPTSEEFSRLRLRRFWPLLAVVQSILLLANWFLYATWISFHPSLDPTTHAILRIAFLVAAVSFVAASVLAWNYFNSVVRIFYVITAVWVGLMTFGLFAAAGCWVVLAVARLAGLQIAPNQIADALFAAAFVVGLYGLINAARVRVNRITVKLPNLPSAWRGRVAALVSDTHLGHIRNVGFMRRIVARLNGLRPDVVLIAGDMYDGTTANVEALAEPLAALSAPLGAFYVTGNHEEFTSRDQYLEAVSKAGVRVLNNEKIELEGLQIVGVHYREFVDPGAFSGHPAKGLDHKRARERAGGTCAPSAEHRRGGGNFASGLRTYARRAVPAGQLDRLPDLWRLCSWAPSLRPDARLYELGRRNLGASLPRGDECRNRAD